MFYGSGVLGFAFDRFVRFAVGIGDMRVRGGLFRC